MPSGALPAADPELHLLPGEVGQVAAGEELAGGQPAGEVVDRRAQHHRVVDVEERAGGRVRRRPSSARLDLGDRRGGGAREGARASRVSRERSFRRATALPSLVGAASVSRSVSQPGSSRCARPAGRETSAGLLPAWRRPDVPTPGRRRRYRGVPWQHCPCASSTALASDRPAGMCQTRPPCRSVPAPETCAPSPTSSAAPPSATPTTSRWSTTPVRADLGASWTSRSTGRPRALRGLGLRARRPGRAAARQHPGLPGALLRARCGPGWSPCRPTPATPGRSWPTCWPTRAPGRWSPPRCRSISRGRPAAGEAPALEHVLVAAPSGPDGTVPLPALLADRDAGPGGPAPPGVRARTWRCCSTPAAPAAGRAARCCPTGRCWPNLEQCGEIRPTVVTPADVLLLAIPLFHAYGLNPGFGMLAWAGATGVLVDRFDPAGSLELMARHRVTNVPGGPGDVRAVGRPARAGRGLRQRAARAVRRRAAAAAAAAPVRRGRRSPCRRGTG